MSTATSTPTVRGTVRGTATRANPAFAAVVVLVPLLALGYAVAFGSVQTHTYVHVMAGVLWTGIDVFMALVLGPVLGSLDAEARASWFETFTPKMTYLMPSLATVTIFGGITLAIRLGAFPNSGPWVALFTFVAFVTATLLLGRVFGAFGDRRWQAFFAVVFLGNGAYLLSELSAAGMTLPATQPVVVLVLAVMVVLTVLGFGFLMPSEVLVYLESMSAEPDKERIGRLGLRNAKVGGVQGAFQLVIVVLMVYLRWGGL